jgi:ferrous iron transport protein B
MIAAFLPKKVYGWWVPGVVMFSMYLLGIIIAPLVAWALKRTLLRGETPVFVMEMPLYKVPSIKTVLRRMFDAGWAFLYRAGTLILASMIVVWALLYFPSRDYEERIAALNDPIKEERDQLEELQKSIAAQTKELKNLAEAAEDGPLTPEQEARRQQLEAEVTPVKEKMKPLSEKVDPVDEKINQLKGEWKSQSILGQLGHAIEPVVAPLGWDWRIATAALASFPAREVVVGTLGIIYSLGDVDSAEIKEAKDAGETDLAKRLKEAKWESGERAGQTVFSIPVALSLMVFFALCCQCASTLAVIKRETRSWGWPVFTFVYMTVLAYVGALVVYQVGSLFS